MTTKSNHSHIHELELMYWETVIQVLGTWQNIYQPSGNQKVPKTAPQPYRLGVEDILFAAAGLGIGIIIGAISRL